MGLEGAVRLGFRKELAAVPEGPEREALYQRLVAQQYEAGGARNMAATLEIDAVIDPAETRRWVLRGLQAAASPGSGTVSMPVPQTAEYRSSSPTPKRDSPARWASSGSSSTGSIRPE